MPKNKPSLISISIHKMVVKVHIPNFGGCQGRRTEVGVTTVSNSLILEGWVTRVLWNSEKIRGWKGGWQQYFDFSYITGSTKNATLKN